MEYKNTLDFALQADASDSLRSYRELFYFPQINGKNAVYLTGNSLGLQPKKVREDVLQELEDWKNHGVEGHFHAKNPWYSYHERFNHGAAKLVGAELEEVVVMNQLTVNLHLLLISFYQPQGKRNKILFETKPFPSDQYAFESHAKLHGLDPDKVLVEMQPREGEVLLREEDIIAKINELGDELAVVCFGAVNYFTGQFFNLPEMTKAAHAQGAMCGFDLAHTAGNMPLRLHDWNVDFACWCSYKYLNSGPGGVSGVFIHNKHTRNPDLLRLAGWWGHDKTTRFQMGPHFHPIASAESWQLSNAPILSMSAHKASLDMFSEVGMSRLRAKSVLLTGYLEFIINDVEQSTDQPLRILTPSQIEQRGCQLSVVIAGKTKSLVNNLLERGIVVDWREPNVIRLAPVPLYNSFEDVYQFGVGLKNLL